MTAIDYAALVERLRHLATCQVHETDTMAEAADALERLTQPVGVEPVARFNISPNSGASSSSSGQWVLHEHHAETVSRLIAERDAATNKLNECFGGTKRDLATKLRQQCDKSERLSKERDALQEQVKTLREYFSAVESLKYTLGNEDATAADENRAEERFNNATTVARRVVDQLRREEALASTTEKEKTE